MKFCFPRTYYESALQFRLQSAAFPAPFTVNQKTYRLPWPGPNHSPLATDLTLIQTDSEVRKLLVVTSGLHGVELFAGSAVQCRLMERLRVGGGGLGKVAVLLVHAVNPFGSAWVRRTNGENVDLTRNCFPDFPTALEAYKGNKDLQGPAELYSRLNSFINPVTLGVADKAQAQFLVLRYGTTALRRALLIGQRANNTGISYGGLTLQPEIALLHAALLTLIQPFQASLQSILHLDIHTGWGGYGEMLALVDDQPSALVLRELGVQVDKSGFGEKCLVPGPEVGCFSNFQHLLALPVPFRSATLEFGTRDELELFWTLRAENNHHNSTSLQAYIHSEIPHFDHKAYLSHPSKATFVEAFSPVDLSWQSSVLQQGSALCLRALHSLASSS